MAYMRRDVERWARTYGFEPQLAAPYLLAEFDLANRNAIVAASEGSRGPCASAVDNPRVHYAVKRQR
jgi:hypothetical protein